MPVIKQSCYKALAWASLLATGTALGNQLLFAQTFSTIYSFNGGLDGSWPCGGVITDGQENLYSSTQFGGGTDNAGTVIELPAGGRERVLHSFRINEGENPCSALFHAANGDIYGTTKYGGSYGGGVLFRLRAGGFEVLHDFGAGSDGSFPVAGVIADPAGNLFGTTTQGGAGACPGGCGTVYQVNTSGNETVLYSFNGPDGAYPSAGLLRDTQGNLYGTTLAGGANNSCQSGCGTVFQLDQIGQFTLLYSFMGGQDGWYVTTGLVRDTHGNLYGTTAGGGTSNLGTIYEISNSGKESVLHSFKGGDGQAPQDLLLTPNHTLYGAAYLGGGSCPAEGQSGCGTIFKFNTVSGMTVLHRFQGLNDGIYPLGPVILDSSGFLYGATELGPKGHCYTKGYGCGTIWKLFVGAATRTSAMN
jgi:uncharacterized repeat protein (TIGR03803 family)